MSRSDIIYKLNEIFIDIFGDDDIVLSEETTPQDVEDWDSIGHVYLTVEIEEEFSIKLGDEMGKVENIKDIIDLIIMRQGEI